MNSVVSKRNTVFSFIFIIAVFSVIILRFVSLDKTFIPSDEGFYITLLRDCPEFNALYRFQILFQGVLGDNVYLIRLLCYGSLILSNLVFSFGLYSYIKKFLKNDLINYLSVLGLVCLGQQYILACPSFNYITMNFIVTEISLGLLFLGIAQRKDVFVALSGFFIGFLIPIMITNIVFIPFILLFISLTVEKKRKGLFSFSIGLLCFILLYFTTWDSPAGFYNYIMSQTHNAVNSGTDQHDHGLLMIIIWIFKTTVYLGILFCFSLVIYGISSLKLIKDLFNKKSLVYSLALIYLIVISILIFIKEDNSMYLFYIGKITEVLLIVFIFLQALQSRIWKDKTKTSLFILLLFCTVCLCFGSNVSFYIRQGTYFAFLLPLILIFDRRKSLEIVYVLLFCTLCLKFWCTDRNWHGDDYSKQTIPVSSIGIDQNVKVDSLYIEKLKFAKDICHEGAYVLNDNETWGEVALLKLKPLKYDFLLKESEIQSHVERIPESVTRFYILFDAGYELNLDKLLKIVENYQPQIYKHAKSKFTIIECHR